MTQGMWPDPRRGGVRAPAWLDEPRQSRIARRRGDACAFVTALGWPLLLAVALSLPAVLAIERAFVVSFAVALIVGERWRDAQRQRDAEALDAFLRALESEDRAFAPTMHASVARPLPPAPPPALGRPRPRVLARPERPSERPTIPD